MAHGPGKYDAQCTTARLATKADGAILIIVNGIAGSGFSCQAEPQVLVRLPAILESLAAQIRADIREGG